MSTKRKLQLYEYKRNAFVPIKVLTHNYNYYTVLTFRYFWLTFVNTCRCHVIIIVSGTSIA